MQTVQAGGSTGDDDADVELRHTRHPEGLAGSGSHAERKAKAMAAAAALGLKVAMG
jgi:hypothetical protein